MKPERKRECMHVNVDIDTYSRYIELARKRNMCASDIIREVLMEYLDAQGEEQV